MATAAHFAETVTWPRIGTIRRGRGSKSRRLIYARRLAAETLEARWLLTSDFGDAPIPYGTLLADDGPRHEIVPGGPTLGAHADAEPDGIPSATATGDDVANSPPDDENGVQFTSPIEVGVSGATVVVNVQGAAAGAKLDAWIDFDTDGSFDAGDQIADNYTVSNGDNVVTFDVPASAVPGNTYARFRLSTLGNLPPTGPANDGEVEDYHVTISGLAGSADVGTLDTQHFIPPFYAVSGLDSGFIDTQYLSLSTPETTPFDVTIRNASGNVLETVPISKATPALLNLSAAPYGQPNYNSLGVVDDNGLNQVNDSDGIILTADKPFYANGRQQNGMQAFSLTSKGRSALGTSFRSGHLNTSTNEFSETVRGHFISVMATEDNTTVTFSDVGEGIFFRHGSGTLPGIPGPVTLHAGESYVVGVRLTDVEGINHNNLNGTLVTSDRPIAVNSGSWTAGNGSGQDIGIDQLLPTNLLGTRYILAKGQATTAAVELETPIVVAHKDNTQVYLNGSSTPVTTINAGEYFIIPGDNFSTSNTMVIETSEPAYVYQSTAGRNSSANVGMNFAVAISDALLPQETVIGNVNQLGTATLNIIGPTGAEVTLDGSVLSGAMPVIGASDYEIYTVSDVQGNASIDSTEPIFISFTTVSSVATAAAYFSGAPNTLAVDDTATTSFDTAVQIDVQGNDNTDSSFTVQAATDPANGSVVLNPNGTITFTPDVGFIGTDIFDYTSSDGTTTVSASVTLTVLPNTFDFTHGSYSTEEGDVSNTTTVVQVQRRGDLSLANSIDVNLFRGAGAPAEPGLDFTPGPITVDFSPGEAFKPVPIEILGETDVELDEFVSLSLSGEGIGALHPTATLVILDDDANVAPIADAGGPYTGSEGAEIILSADGTTDPDGDALTYRWDFESDGTWDTGWMTDPAMVHTWPDDGAYTVTLKVSDGELEDIATAPVTVQNVAPTLSVSGALSVDEGSTYVLSLSSSDPGADTIDQWTIFWGDGSDPDGDSHVGEIVAGNPPSLTHTYVDGPRVHTILATATDEDGTYEATAFGGNAIVSPDPSFGGGGEVTEDFFGSTADFVRELTLIQPDGKVLVAGYTSGGNDNIGLARYNPDGTPDVTFGSLGKVVTEFGQYESANALALDSTGRIVLGGNFGLVRYLSNGALDSTFGVDGRLTILTGIRDVVIDSQERIIASTGNYLQRFAEDVHGIVAVDQSFNGGNRVYLYNLIGNFYAYDVTVDASDRILLAGRIYVRVEDDPATPDVRESDYSHYDAVVARLTTAGELDTTFGTAGITNTGFSAVTYHTGYVSVDFGGRKDFGEQISLQDDHIVIGGSTDDLFDSINRVDFDPTGQGRTDRDLALIRLDSHGALDTSFGMGGAEGDGLVQTHLGAHEYVLSMVIASQSEILLGTSGYYWTRYTANGELDTTLNPASSYPGRVYSHVGRVESIAEWVDSGTGDRFVFAAGYHWGSGGQGANFAVAKYQWNDASLDPTFGPGGPDNIDGVVTTDFEGSTADYVRELVVTQSDGKILVAGYKQGGVAELVLARYLGDGSLDPGFGVADGDGIDGMVVDERYRQPTALLVAADGKIVVADLNYLLRYHPDGSPDNTFGSSATSNSVNHHGQFTRVEDLDMDVDGKLVAVGYRYRGSNAGDANSVLARYHAETDAVSGTTAGDLDTSFGTEGVAEQDLGSLFNSNYGTVEVVNGIASLTGGSWPWWLDAGDVLVTGGQAHTITSTLADSGSILFQNPDGSLSDPVDTGGGTGTRSVAIEDLNGDGHPDMVFANRDNDNVSIVLQDASTPGTFLTAVNYAAGDGAVSVAVGDLDGDSLPDLAVANFYDDTVSILKQDVSSPGTFGAPAVYATGSRPRSVAIADLNGDGRLDLAVANRVSQSVSVLVQDVANPGSFLVKQDYATGGYAVSVKTADLNNDTLPDLAVANGNTDNVAVLLQDPATPGTFLSATTYATGREVNTVAIGDLDGDGRPDLVTANRTSNSVSVLLQDPGHSGQFLARRDYHSGGSGAHGVAIGDIDGDLWPDLVVGNTFSNNVAMLSQDPSNPGTFLTAQTFATGDRPVDVAVADLNGDGRLDVVTANEMHSSSLRCVLDDNTVNVAAGNSYDLYGGSRLYFDGTIQVVNGIATLTDGAWPFWAQSDDELLVGSNTYTITSRDSDTQLTLEPFHGSPVNEPAGSEFHLLQPVRSIDYWEDVEVDVDGNIVAAGYSSSYDYHARRYRRYTDFFVARYTPHGVLDTTFGVGHSLSANGVTIENSDGLLMTDLGGSDYAYSFDFDSSGRIVVGGSYDLARYLSDGTLDSSFDSDGMVHATSYIRSLTLDADGRIITGGSSYLSRYHEDGSPDTQFAPSGRLVISGRQIEKVAVDNASRIIVAGNTHSSGNTGVDFWLGRYLTGGLSVTVNNVPPQNVTVGGPTTSEEGDEINLSASATDPAGVYDPLTYTWSITRNGQPFVQTTGEHVTFVAPDDGSYLATMTVDDGDGGEATRTHAITVDNVAPTATFHFPTAAVDEGSPIDLSLSTPSDPSSVDTAEGFEYAFDFGDGYGPFTTTSSGAFSPPDNGVRTVKGKIRDKDGGVTEYTATVEVANVAPVVTMDTTPVVIDEGQSASKSITTSDVPDDTVSVTASRGNITGSGDHWTWSYDGLDDLVTTVVTITATDEDGGVTSETFNLTVHNVVPVLTLDTTPLVIDEGTSASKTITTHDVPADTVSVAASLGTITGAGDNWTWSYDGLDDLVTTVVTITATDEDGGVTSDTFELTVNNVAPDLTLDTTPAVIDEGSSASKTVTTSDVPADTVRVITSLGTITGTGDNWTWSYDGLDDLATRVVTITATDEDGGVTSETFDLTVHNVVPVLTLDTTPLVIDEGTSASKTITTHDVPADTVSVTASLGTITGAGDNWAWSYDGLDDLVTTVVTITATDEDGGVTSDTFELTVNNVAPDLTLDTTPVVIDEASSASKTITTSDVPADTVSVTTSLGTITGSGDNWTWSYDGLDDLTTTVVTITATEEDGGITSETFDLTVHNVVPVLTLDTTPVVIDEGTSASKTITTHDVPADTVSVAASLGTITGAGDNWTWSYDGLDDLATRVVTITATDEDGGVTSETFDLTVLNVAPTADDASYDLVENTPDETFVGAVTATDPGDDTLTYSITGGTGETVFAIDPNTGDITVADSGQLDYEIYPSFTLEVTVTDDDLGSDTAVVTVNLLNQASIDGTVFVDVDQDGLYDGNEMGIDHVIIELLDELGVPVLDDQGQPITAITQNGGYYLFDDLAPGTYQLHELQPTGVQDGEQQLGNLGGEHIDNDVMQLTLQRTDAEDYIFAELGQQVGSGDTATIGFWQNKHGQALIAQGGAGIAVWLTDNFPNVFGNEFVGATGSEVANFYKQELFRQKSRHSAGPAKIDAQFMAVALATYFTSSDISGGVFAQDFGFTVTNTGIGTRIVNVGTSGAAFDMDDYSNCTIMQLLEATNRLTDEPNALTGFASTYDTNGDGEIDAHEAALRAMANSLYTWINEQGS